MTECPIDVLVVDDDPADLELVLQTLQKYNLVNQVAAARDGAEAVERIFGTHPPKLILLDLKLPKVSGLEILRRMKADARTRAVPVIMLTSSLDHRDLTESYRLGAKSYIIKPADFPQLAEAVRQIGLRWALLGPAAKEGRRVDIHTSLDSGGPSRRRSAHGA